MRLPNRLQILNLQSLDYSRVLHDLTLCYKICMTIVICDRTVSSSLVICRDYFTTDIVACYMNAVSQLAMFDLSFYCV